MFLSLLTSLTLIKPNVLLENPTPIKKKVTILALDGGGIRGLIPAQFLNRLEKKIQEKTSNPEARLADYFDLIAGTSTGGLLTMMYLIPNQHGRPKYSAEDVVKAYREEGPRIFKKFFFGSDWWQTFKTVFTDKYSSTNIERAANKLVGNGFLSDLLRPAVIMAFNTTTDTSTVLKQPSLAKREGYDYYLKDVARATSAAPTFFPEATIPALDPLTKTHKKTYTFIDGGIAANNPTLVALTVALTVEFGKEKGIPRDLDDILLVSLGTGRVHNANAYAKRRGYLGWFTKIVDVFMRGTSQESDFIVHALTFKRKNKTPHQFLRVDPFLSRPDKERLDIAGLDEETVKRIQTVFPCDLKCSETMDCVSENNLNNLVKLGDLCADKLPDLLNIKLPSCKSHDNYSEITLDNLAEQLIKNNSLDKSFKAVKPN